MAITALLISNDLFFSSRVTSAAQQSGLAMSVVMNLNDVLTRVREAAVQLAVLDLTMPGLDLSQLVPELRQANAAPVTVIAYGPHVDEVGLVTARDTGCDEVYARGQFNSQLVSILSRFGRDAAVDSKLQ